MIACASLRRCVCVCVLGLSDTNICIHGHTHTHTQELETFRAKYEQEETRHQATQVFLESVL